MGFVAGKKVTAGIVVWGVCAIVLLSRREERDDFVLTSIKESGYDGESHHTVTEDGYISGIHRILKMDENNKTVKHERNYPILFVHGLESSAADWMHYHGKESLPFLSSEKGFDIWLGNVRGTQSSLNHTSMDPKKDPQKFWNSSVHEIGYYDLPAMVDHVSDKSNSEKLFYVGMSQGEATFLIMASTRPEYNKKIQLASSTSPSSHLKHSDNVVMKTLGAAWPLLQFGAGAIRLHTVPGRDLIGTACQYQILSQICNILSDPFLGYSDQDQTTSSNTWKIFQIYPVNSAFKQSLHYLQMYHSGIFRRFDYGTGGNLMEYGREDPPEYDMRKIVSPVAYFWGENDCWSRPKDVAEIEEKLPNLVLSYRVPHKSFNHYDVLVAKDAKALVYHKIMETIARYNETK